MNLLGVRCLSQSPSNSQPLELRSPSPQAGINSHLHPTEGSWAFRFGSKKLIRLKRGLSLSHNLFETDTRRRASLRESPITRHLSPTPLSARYTPRTESVLARRIPLIEINNASWSSYRRVSFHLATAPNTFLDYNSYTSVSIPRGGGRPPCMFSSRKLTRWYLLTNIEGG